MSAEGPLDIAPERFASWVEAALERLKVHLARLPEQPLSDTRRGAELAEALRRDHLPREGSPIEGLLDAVMEAAETGFNTASGGYLAFVPGGGVLPAAVADLVASAINRYVGVWIAAPGLVQLEQNVLRWCCELVGYPAEALGILTSGGSLANFSALVTARRERLPADFLSGVVYATRQTHHSVAKAAMLAGFPPERVHAIDTDARFCIDLRHLEAAIAEDRAAGLTPFCVVGNAGTTNTGALDDLDALADLAEAEGLWLHADAAYGGFFALTERGRAALAGLSRADSITLDPHKGLFLPYGTGCLLVRDGAALTRAHALTSEYMPASTADDQHLDFCHMSPELSRPFRGLAVWLALELLGADAFEATLDEKIDLAAEAYEGLLQIPEIEVVAPPQLSILAFRWRPEGASDDVLDALNQRLIEAINARQRVFLTPTILDGRFVIRICVMHFRTHRIHIQHALEDLRASIAALRESEGGGLSARASDATRAG